MRYLAAILLALISAPAWANELDSLLQQAKALGAPMAAVQRAIEISRQPIFAKKDALAVFDISQPSAKKRFYVFGFQIRPGHRPLRGPWKTQWTQRKSDQIQGLPDGPGHGAAGPA